MPGLLDTALQGLFRLSASPPALPTAEAVLADLVTGPASVYGRLGRYLDNPLDTFMAGTDPLAAAIAQNEALLLQQPAPKKEVSQQTAQALLVQTVLKAVSVAMASGSASGSAPEPAAEPAPDPTPESVPEPAAELSSESRPPTSPPRPHPPPHALATTAEPAPSPVVHRLAGAFPLLTVQAITEVVALHQAMFNLSAEEPAASYDVLHGYVQILAVSGSMNKVEAAMESLKNAPIKLSAPFTR